MSQPRSVLLIHPGALGDLLQALPAMASVRGSFPSARLALLVGAPFAAFAEGTGLFDEVVPFDADVAYHGAPWARIRLLATLVGAARRRRPERVGVFKAAPVYALLALGSGARRRVGLARGPGRWLLHDPIDGAWGEHREERLLAVARALGARTDAAAVVRWSRAELPLELQGLAGTRPLIGIAPGGARNVKDEMPQRRWPASRHAELAARLLADAPDARLVLLGGDGDRAEADVVRRALPAHAVVDVVGRTTLAQARAIIEALDVLVVHDSALMHLAATTGTEVVAIFGPTDPHATCPRGARVHALWEPARARPCYDERTGVLSACDALCCIDRVSVDQVHAAVRAALGRATARATTASGAATARARG